MYLYTLLALVSILGCLIHWFTGRDFEEFQSWAPVRKSLVTTAASYRGSSPSRATSCHLWSPERGLTSPGRWGKKKGVGKWDGCSSVQTLRHRLNLVGPGVVDIFKCYPSV